MLPNHPFLFLFLSIILGYAKLCYGNDAKPVVITCGQVAQEYKACKEGVARWEKKTGKKATVIPAPNGSNERLTIFQQNLAAKSNAIDVYQIDVVWPGLLAPHFVDLKPYLTPERQAAYIPAILNNNTVEGKIVALPWFLSMSIFYYRKDLLDKYKFPIPQSWEEMEATAKEIMALEKKAGNPDIWGFVFQGKAYEGLTCNALDWINSYKNGGTIVDLHGRVTINNPDAIQMLNRAASWIGTISPTGVLNYEQEDCRGVFQAGKTIFMRNWSYAWTVLNGPESPMQGKVGIAPMPQGGKEGKSAGTIGGWNLAVSKYSENQQDAIDLVLYLTSDTELRQRAFDHGYHPTMIAPYKDPKILAISPIMKIIHKIIHEVTMRPAGQTGPKYSQVSANFWYAVHATLSGRQDAVKSLRDLEKKLNFLSKNGTKWIKKNKG